MPTYQYRCKECDHEFEIVQSFSDDALTTCPECQGALKKVYGAVGISFKGSGFYKTDSRGKKSSTTSAGSKKDADSSPSGSSDSTSSDSAGSSAKKETSSTSSTSTSSSTSGSSD